jgi:diguanylate cyclase (GGDEF)-like protein
MMMATEALRALVGIRVLSGKAASIGAAFAPATELTYAHRAEVRGDSPMKIFGARPEPLSGPRARDVATRPTTSASAGDQVRILGVSEAELTPRVAGAIAALMLEIDTLREEVRRLKARLEQAETAADEDPLTGVRNRRGFLRELKRSAALAGRHDLALSLAYFDLDDLKSLNDTRGHAAGDAALTYVAQRLSANVRESDAVGRIGGDEFAVLLLNADAEAAAAKAQSLAFAIESEPVGAEGSRLRLSWGVRQIDPGQNLEPQIAAADAAMFEMKRSRTA